MKTLAEEGNKSAKRVVKITDNFDKALVTLLIGINVIYVSSSTLATVLAMQLLNGKSYASLLATVIMTLVVFIFSETIPKNFARANSDAFAMAISFPVSILMKIMTPISAVFSFIGDKVKDLFRKEGKAPTVTEDEFASIVDDIEEEGVIDSEESDIIKSAIEFGELTVREVMTDITRTVTLDQSSTENEIKKIVLNTQFSRIPVYKDDVNHIVGIIQTSDCLWRLMNDIPVDIKTMLKKPYLVRPDKKVNDLFEEMEKKRTHIAIVTEKGATLGIITMEDILEEIVGEIYDEEEVIPPQRPPQTPLRTGALKI